jgi:cyanophycin synthetase
VPSASIIAAARNRDIPVAQDELRGVIELGNGAWRQRISGAVTSRTSLLGERITRDKVWTNRLLREAGLPVPAGMTVRTLEQALHAATAIGYPVVAKPPDQGASTGAYPDLRNETELIASFPRSLAASPSGKVLIEQHLTGRKYRAIVVDSRIVSVLHHIPAHVVGDGARSIRELIEATNADPRRGTRVGSPLAPISIDATLLRMIARELLSLDDVPAQGRFIQLKPIPRWGDGGTCIECTGQVHPHNAAIILQALAVVGLDVTALELITPDISKSIWESSGAIIDINTGITFRSELMPTEGHPRDPGPAVVDMLFPPGQPVRAPIIAVTGAGNRAAICRAIAQELSETGHAVGLATTDAVTINGTELKGVDASGLAGARTVLRNPAVEIAVIEVAPESILQDGLGFDYCDLAVVTSLSGLRTPFDQPVESVLASLLDSAGVVLVDVDIPAVSTLDISSSIPLIPLRLDPTTPTFLESISAVIPTRPNSL